VLGTGDGVDALRERPLEMVEGGARRLLRPRTRRRRLDERRQLAPHVTPVAPVGDLLQRRLALTTDPAEPQGVAGAMHPPVFRIVVDVGDVVGTRNAERESCGKLDLAETTVPAAPCW